MKKEVDLSVIVVNYNTFDYTAKCLESVLAHCNEIDKEIILVDNASNEKDPAAFKKQFPSIHLIESKVNLGYAGGNNLGIAEARGRYILLLNSDVLIQNNVIEEALRFMKDHPKTGAMSTRLVYPDGRHQPVANRFPFIQYEILELLRVHKLVNLSRVMLGPFFDHEKAVGADWIWGAFFMMSRQALHALGGKLPEDFFMYVEDLQWCYQIKKAGFRVDYYPCGDVIHYVSQSDEENSAVEKLKKILPNEFRFISQCKGSRYARLFYRLRYIKQRVSREPGSRAIAAVYWDFIGNGYRF